MKKTKGSEGLGNLPKVTQPSGGGTLGGILETGGWAGISDHHSDGVGMLLVSGWEPGMGDARVAQLVLGHEFSFQSGPHANGAPTAFSLPLQTLLSSSCMPKILDLVAQ